ncbi:MAG TPA: hypothetical protein VFD59_01865 [Nocardioidaceae bacterium]|nr:hypothetical protein [Nocardioidaceae bacterium]
MDHPPLPLRRRPPALACVCENSDGVRVALRAGSYVEKCVLEPYPRR